MYLYLTTYFGLHKSFLILAVDGGLPYRRTVGDNITYTDWKRDNFYTTVKGLLSEVKKLGIEHDHITVERKALLEEALPEVTLVDVAKACMTMRMVKSDEEIALITKNAAIADIGAAAAVKVMKEGVPEYEVALASTQAMVREIAKTFPNAELSDSRTGFHFVKGLSRYSIAGAYCSCRPFYGSAKSLSRFYNLS